jgi:hypothetical protein
MNDETELIPVEQRVIPFEKDSIIAVRMVTGDVFVPLRHICSMIGVDWGGQRRRVQNDPVLIEVVETIDITVTDEYRTIRRSMLCLPLDYLQGFLFGINPNRVRADLREPLMRYQRDAYKILNQAFREGQLSINDATLTRAIASFGQLEQRLDAIEARLGDPARLLTVDQARRVADAVQSVAFELGRRSGRNEYGGVYSELYRRYDVPDYRSLPAARFDECMDWLRQWYETLTDDSLAEF